ncbi:MAG: L,D-transpeptidase [Nocardioides sp.]
MSRHRLEVRPRYGRIVVLASALVVTGVAVLGGIGLLPRDASSEAVGSEASGPGTLVTAELDAAPSQPAATRRPSEPARGDGARERIAVATPPADSGTGRRVVFSEELQRVWLVTADERVQRTYLVSGSVYDNLDPGSYEVYSRSQRAWGIDDSGSMKWFVRFTRGDNAAIGFHDIPVAGGEPVQTMGQLGTPLSHGCIRQKESDARALWAFAPLGTPVIVV